MEKLKSGNDLIYSEYQGEYFNRGDKAFIFCEYMDDFVYRFNAERCQITDAYFLKEDIIKTQSGQSVFKELTEKCTKCRTYHLKIDMLNSTCSHCITSN